MILLCQIHNEIVVLLDNFIFLINLPFVSDWFKERERKMNWEGEGLGCGERGRDKCWRSERRREK